MHVLAQRESVRSHFGENPPDIVFRLDRSLRHLYISPMGDQSGHASLQSFLGKTHRELGQAPAICDRLESAGHAALATGHQQMVEFEQYGKILRTLLIPTRFDGDEKTLLGLTTDLSRVTRPETNWGEGEEGFCIVEVLFDERNQPADYRFLEVNPSFEQQTGLAGAVGKRMREFAPNHEEHWFETYGRIALTGRPARFQNRAEHLGRWYDVYAFRFGDPEKRQVAIHFNDISARKQTEEALREANQKLQTVLDSIGDGLAVLDKNWRYIYFNEQGARIIGVRPEQVLGGCVWELFPHAKGTKFQEFYHRAVETSQPVQFEEFYPEPLNLWLECRCFPSSEGLSVYFHDITSRKQAEAMLRQNEALFSALVDLAPTGVYVVDGHFRLQQINALAMPAFAQVDPKIGRDFSEVMHILWGPDLGAQIVKIFRHTLATGEPFVSPRFSEHRQDLGEDRAYEWEIQRVTLPDGQHGVVCYFNDITTRIRTEQALVQAKADAESANRSKDQFLAALSHELRTPLNPALLIASEAAGNRELPERVRLDFEAIRKSIELEARLIDDLLDLTRITAGKMTLDRALVNIQDVLTDALATIETARREKDIQLTLSFEAETAVVEGDAVRLQQVFWNILKNAVKFTPNAGRITIKTSVQGTGQLAVAITDTGIGMSREEVARAFAAFAQGDHAHGTGSHQFGGLGLGLAISKNLVELHSGKILAESAGCQQGSTFTVELPLAGEFKSWRQNEPAPVAPLGSNLNDRAALCILLVEDHEATRTVLAQLLERRNYQVLTAGSIAKAREIASQSQFDLLISDIGLPDGNGNDLMNELREKHGIKGIALTGYGMEEDIARGQASGFVTHLIKPVRIQSLENALAMVKGLE